ncbi:MAG: GNAT family N-acetyltransferase [Acidobacteriota bacterium]
MWVLETARLKIRRLSTGDADFIRRLLNEPSFIRYIGDRGIRSEEDASRYIREGPMASYAQHGFGLYLVELKNTGASAGICGLLKRDSLEDVDIGFAFLPEFWRQGFAFEAAEAVLSDAEERGFTRVLAITSPDNVSSIRLLEKLGFRFDRMMRQRDDASEIKVFARGRPVEIRR